VVCDCSDELKKLKLYDNTIIILWGDNGYLLGEHGMWTKHCYFELSLRVPLMIKAPGHKGGSRTNALVELVDIYPSLCELAGLSLPDHLEGTSFVPLMKDPNRKWKTVVFSRYYNKWKYLGVNSYYNGRSIKTDRYRFTITTMIHTRT
jgi:arylsulfatase A-like enzyme